VIENFQESPAISDGLAIMVQAYILLDLAEPADKSLTVLRNNYPGHESLDSSGNFTSDFKLEEAEESRLKNTGNRMFNQPNTPSFDNRL
jgi:outer membrane protein assembly factor BamD